MKILSLETSTTQGSIAIWQGGQLLFFESFQQPRGRGETLLTAVEGAIKKSGTVDCIAVGTGPGSYNGIRGAIAVAEGLKIAWRASVLGVSSLLAVPSTTESYAVVGDARGDSFFFGTVVKERIAALCLVPSKELRARLEAWNGPVYTAERLPEFPNLLIQPPNAERLALFVASHPGHPDFLSVLTPIYLKPPHITQPTISHLGKNNGQSGRSGISS